MKKSYHLLGTRLYAEGLTYITSFSLNNSKSKQILLSLFTEEVSEVRNLPKAMRLIRSVLRPGLVQNQALYHYKSGIYEITFQTSIDF